MYQKVMVPLDGSELAECVLPHLESLAKAGQVQNVALVRVAESFDTQSWGGTRAYLSDEDVKQFDVRHQDAAQKYLNELLGRLKLEGASVEKVVLSGRAAEQLAEYANKNNVDLVIISTHGRSGVSRWVWGSIADRLLHSVNAPVLMVRPPGCLPGI
jgi:nucleotide-binding universal stress UspA family protein